MFPTSFSPKVVAEIQKLMENGGLQTVIMAQSDVSPAKRGAAERQLLLKDYENLSPETQIFGDETITSHHLNQKFGNFHQDINTFGQTPVLGALEDINKIVDKDNLLILTGGEQDIMNALVKVSKNADIPAIIAQEKKNERVFLNEVMDLKKTLRPEFLQTLPEEHAQLASEIRFNDRMIASITKSNEPKLALQSKKYEQEREKLARNHGDAREVNDQKNLSPEEIKAIALQEKRDFLNLKTQNEKAVELINEPITDRQKENTQHHAKMDKIERENPRVEHPENIASNAIINAKIAQITKEYKSTQITMAALLGNNPDQIQERMNAFAAEMLMAQSDLGKIDYKVTTLDSDLGNTLLINKNNDTVIFGKNLTVKVTSDSTPTKNETSFFKQNDPQPLLLSTLTLDKEQTIKNLEQSKSEPINKSGTATSLQSDDYTKLTVAPGTKIDLKNFKSPGGKSVVRIQGSAEIEISPATSGQIRVDKAHEGEKDASGKKGTEPVTLVIPTAIGKISSAVTKEKLLMTIGSPSSPTILDVKIEEVGNLNLKIVSPAGNAVTLEIVKDKKVKIPPADLEKTIEEAQKTLAARDAAKPTPEKGASR